MDEQEIIRRDQEQHPECSYSISSSQSCQMVNGETSCETIRRVLRLCPSQAPCEIFRNKETTQRDAGAEAPLFGTPGMAGRLPQDDMEKEMQGMLKEFSSASTPLFPLLPVSSEASNHAGFPQGTLACLD
uniref:Uncharacterized protein n=1 Tax=Rhizochromulina marina TaxID=1034831 RepID=A0A7S2R8P8_9STRA|mmetsp:Transcript_12696/g.36788  ORF Transcript_12696/g.36788 Transcript_12696/m.36788 type:complete len:130 (+) Transcript_12696:93-482(+)